jgi:hypothetical protein
VVARARNSAPASDARLAHRRCAMFVVLRSAAAAPQRGAMCHRAMFGRQLWRLAARNIAPRWGAGFTTTTLLQTFNSSGVAFKCKLSSPCIGCSEFLEKDLSPLLINHSPKRVQSGWMALKARAGGAKSPFPIAILPKLVNRSEIGRNSLGTALSAWLYTRSRQRPRLADVSNCQGRCSLPLAVLIPLRNSPGASLTGERC